MKTSQSTERTAFYAGSFDPFTLGHHDIARRALQVFDRLVVGIGVNPDKQGFLAAAQRKRWIEQVFAGEPRVEVVCYDGLTVDAARDAGACCLVRGARGPQEFDEEMRLAAVNRDLDGIETVILPGNPALAHVSSTLVRQLIAFGRPVAHLLPPGAPLELLP